MTAPPDNGHPSTPDHTLDTACKLLANANQRAIVQYFMTEETDIAHLDDVVDHVSEEVEDVTTSNQARIVLIHTHLPKLADHGVIEYDQRSETIRYRDGDHLEGLLQMVTPDDPT